MSEAKTAFQSGTVVIPLTKILPIRPFRPKDEASAKFRTIETSLKEIGLIEPLVVYPQKGHAGTYILLNGHFRIEALKRLGHSDALCLVSIDDDAFTYNDKVSHISPIQEHAMIMRAIGQGVAPEVIAKTLDKKVQLIRSEMNLLDGINAEAIELLKDKPITSAALRLFKKVKAARQIDMAQTMVTVANYTHSYAKALLYGTMPDQLQTTDFMDKSKELKPEEIARMQEESSRIEKEMEMYRGAYGENSLKFNAAQRYLKRLLDNARIARFLEKSHRDILDEFREIVALEAH
jgi:ParB-like chromosome segregation protein Spo0J